LEILDQLWPAAFCLAAEYNRAILASFVRQHCWMRPAENNRDAGLPASGG
jgi:hypothetical protein